MIQVVEVRSFDFVDSWFDMSYASLMAVGFER
jgi:hypothetical protein